MLLARAAETHQINLKAARGQRSARRNWCSIALILAGSGVLAGPRARHKAMWLEQSTGLASSDASDSLEMGTSVEACLNLIIFISKKKNGSDET